MLADIKMMGKAMLQNKTLRDCPILMFGMRKC